MIKELVTGAVIAASSLSYGNDADFVYEARPTVDFENISQLTLVSKETRFSANLRLEYNIPVGFSFDVSRGELKSDLVECWKKPECGFVDWDLVRGPLDGTLKYDGTLSFDGLDVVRGLEEIADVDFGIFDVSLDRLREEVNVLDRYSRTERGDGFWKYDIDLDADANLKMYSALEKKLTYIDGSEVKTKYGAYGFGKFRANIKLNMNANWNEKELKGKAEVGVEYHSWLEIDKGGFFEMTKKKDNFVFGGGVIKEDTEETISLKDYFFGVNVDSTDLSIEAFVNKSKIEEKSKEEKDVGYLVAGFDYDVGWGFSNVGGKRFKETVYRDVNLREDKVNLDFGGLERKEIESDVLDEKKRSYNNFVYGIAGGVRVFNAGNFEVDVSVYSKKLFDEASGFGWSFRSGILNMTTEEDDYFAAVKFTGEGGSFEGDFRERTKRRGSFIEKYGASNLWQDKKGIYGFIERKNGEEKTGAAVCFDDSCFVGGRVDKEGKEGYFVGVETDRFSINGSYSVSNGGSEKCHLGMELKLRKDLSVGIFGNLLYGKPEGSAMFKFLF